MVKKEKTRYIAFRIHSTGPVGWHNLRDAVMEGLERWLGQFGLAMAKVSLMRNLWDAKTQSGVIKCSNKYVDGVKLGLALICQIGDEKVVFHTYRVSGTIKGLKL